MQSAQVEHMRAGNPRLASAMVGKIFRRAVIVALVTGSVLALANQFGAIFGNEEIEYLPLALFYLTPLVVVTASQILGIRSATKDVMQRGAPAPRDESMLATALGMEFRCGPSLLG
ncbi:MAG: hypothetical protein D6763_02960 [Alphaproteobacteria bacterium]|nr:MAG: hypothetical protein D6763_02960 [Alphaproteobacteria bacterium]